MAQYLTITLTSIYYGMLFAWSVGITICHADSIRRATV